MHSTEHNNIYGFIDTKRVVNRTIHVLGWCMTKDFEVNSLRVKCDNRIITALTFQRDDVCSFYKTDVKGCGWSFEAPLPCQLQMFTTEWITVFSFQDSVKLVEINNSNPSYIVVDNFYKTPDQVREFALQCDFKLHPNNHKGRRTDECFRFEGLKERFEEIVGKKIKNWDFYGCNGCFQYCIAGDQLVYHCDLQEYAGVLFLTPDAPVQTGTSLFRSKHTKKMKVEKDERNIVFRNGFYDSTEFDKVDTVGNVYNRLVLFDAQTIHAASEYFGTTKENGRLFQLFFFDLEK